MAPRNSDYHWLIEENIPQISDDLRRRLIRACQKTGMTPEIMDEVDEVIEAATKAIRKHYEQLACHSATHNCSNY